MNIILYKFSKKDNSTARPTGGTTFSCKLKEDCSILNPVIDINTPAGAAWPDYNMAYIADFGRYYRINDIVASTGLWTISMQTDVLATYKTEIGNSSLYVLRSASAYDGTLKDDYYPMKADVNSVVTVGVNPWHSGTGPNVDPENDGCFVLGIVSKQNVQPRYGSVVYYAFTSANLVTLVTQLLTDFVTAARGFDLADASLALQTAMVDPLQYIKTCVWIPKDYNSILDTQQTTLDIFGVTITADNKPLTMFGTGFTQSVTLTKHPDAASRGKWLNVSPWSEYRLRIPPIGSVNLDTTLLIDETQIDYEIRLDYMTGLGIIRGECHTSKAQLFYLKTQIGVPIILSQVVKDIVGSGLGIAGGVAAFVGGVMSGNAAVAVGGAVATIGSIAGVNRPHESSTGSAGSFSELCGYVTLYQNFFHPASENNAEVGRPLCETRTINTLSGYIKALGDVSISGTSGEQAEVKAFIEGGFFYE